MERSVRAVVIKGSVMMSRCGGVLELITKLPNDLINLSHGAKFTVRVYSLLAICLYNLWVLFVASDNFGLVVFLVQNFVG